MDTCDRTNQLRHHTPKRWRQIAPTISVLLLGAGTLLSDHQPSVASTALSAISTRPITVLTPPQTRWHPNPDRGTALSTLSGGRRGAHPMYWGEPGVTLAFRGVHTIAAAIG